MPLDNKFLPVKFTKITGFVLHKICKFMISFKNIALRRGPRVLFDQVTLLLNQSERIGVVGENGCGKSTLFSFILGQLSSDQGEIWIRDDLVIGHVSQQTPSSDQSALDYVLDGDQVLREVETALTAIDHAKQGEQAANLFARLEQVGGYSAPARAARLLHGLGFTNAQLEAPTRSFSGGWRVRLNLAQALMCPSDLLLLDEPTNHLDLDAVMWLEDWLHGYRGTLLMISHDRDFLDAICGRILHIENKRIRSYSGDYSQFERTRAEVLANEQAAFAKQQRAIAHMQSYITRFKAKATKARQAQSRIKALERMQVLAPAHINSPFRFAFFQPNRASDPILKLEDVVAGYGDEPVLNNINISLGSSDRIALVGPNGAGKSTLIKLLAGQLSPEVGHITSAKGLDTGYFAQHQLEQLDPEASPVEQMLRVFPNTRLQELRNYLGGFGFRGDRVNEKIGPFSGGEKARLALAILIYHKPNLLLMDEPTNHLDLEMRHALTVAFQNYQGAILLVSHDRHLIRTVTDQLWLVNEGSVSSFDDDIDGYIKWTRQVKVAPFTASHQLESDQVADTPRTDSSQLPGLSKKEKRQQAAKLREKVKPLTQKIREIESNLERTRQSVTDLETLLSDPKTYDQESTAKLAEMMRKKSSLEKTIDADEVKWFEVSEQLEQVNAQIQSSLSVNRPV